MLKAIFYCRFHPERGPSVVHQYPNNSTVTRSSSGDEPLLSFSDISSYLIPPYDLCNIPLSICSNGFRVLGFPVSLEDSEYERNRFTFNVCFVLDENENARPWQQIVDKTAAFFKEVEEDSGILQAEERLEGLKWAGEVGYPADDVGVVHDLLGTIYEDVNAYGETCVRVDELHVLNLRLSPPKAKAPKVRAWDVPLLIRPLPSSDEWTWDLTLQRIYPQIDGIKHAQRISELADVELKLVKKAVRELLYHERVMLLDLFHFQAIYALTSEFAWFVRDDAAQDECCKYIATDPANNIFKSARQLAAKQQSAEPPSREAVIALYRDLNPGVSLSDFCLINESKLASVDVRRFITFGVIKGFVRRIHKYAMATDAQLTSTRTKLSNGST